MPRHFETVYRSLQDPASGAADYFGASSRDDSGSDEERGVLFSGERDGHCVRINAGENKRPLFTKDRVFSLTTSPEFAVCDNSWIYCLGMGMVTSGIYSGYGNGLSKEGEAAFCLRANDSNAFALPSGIRYITVREACRLQGFPDWWCDGLEDEDPSDDLIQFWIDLNRQVGKKKTENQIRKWLAHPWSYQAEYKMWGNGISLPCALFVMDCIQANGEIE